MRTFTEMKFLIFSDFKRLSNKKSTSFATVAVNCMKDSVLSTIVYYRISNYFRSLKKPHRVLKRIIKYVLRPRKDMHIHEKARIGPGLRIYHGSGLAIGNGTIAGKNLTLRHGVTIGNNVGSVSDDWNSCPTLGDNVEVGCYAAILGNVVIGNNAKIGAHALVLRDVPDNCMAIGTPGRIIRNFSKPYSNEDDS